MADWKALCEELVDALTCHYPGHVDDDELIKRARAALAETEPEAGEPTDEKLLEINDRAYCPCTDEVNDEDDSSWQYTSDYIRWLDENGTPEEQGAYAAKGLRAVFNAGRRYGHQPEPPAAGEVAELVAALRIESSRCTCTLLTTDDLRRAADLLEQRHPAPVPVSERLPELGDCDGEHYCWRWNTIGGLWARQPLARSWYEFESHWLPATALPLPSGEVE